MAHEKIPVTILAIFLLLVSCKAGKQDLVNLTPREVIEYKTVTDITENDIRWHIGVLASDSMYGRKAGTLYETLAADYIKERFKSLGLKSFNDNYYQSVPITSRRYFQDCEINFEDYKGDYPADFRPMIMFDSLTVASEVVFAGYGNDSDYENLNVKGKWVMILEGSNSILYERKTTAKTNGALGVLAIGKDGTSGEERYVLHVDSVPIIRISQNLSDRLLAYAGTNVSEVLEKVKTGEKQNIHIPVIVNATVKSTTQWVSSQNVVAYLEASDSNNENEYIVIGAHYDHIGTKTVGDSILVCTGADDNASGVAGILEIAEKLCSEKKLKYNILFAAFGAEELGLIGSGFFCNNPPVPLERIKLMINLDMIGRMDSSNHAYISTIEPNDRLNAVADRIKDSHPDINAVISLDNHLRNTDHSSFYKKHVPAMSFTTGLHSAYHTPADTIGSINYRGEKLLLNYVYDFIKEASHNN